MTNHQITTLQEDIETATSAKQIDVSHILNSLYPRALEALDSADSVEDVNTIRHGLEAIVTVTNKHLPKYVKDRVSRLKKANKGNDTYLQACRAAGRMWLVTDKYRGRPPDSDSDDQLELELETESIQEGTLLLPKIRAEDAGFTSNRDAQRCVKAAQIHDEDYRTYREECDQNGRQYTLGGLENLYSHLHPKEGGGEGEFVQFSTRSILKRLEGLAKKTDALLEHVEGDVYNLVEKARDALNDAVEIVRDSDDD